MCWRNALPVRCLRALARTRAKLRFPGIWINVDEKRTGALSHHRDKGAIQFVRGVGLHNFKPHSERSRRTLDLLDLEIRPRTIRVYQEGDHSCLGYCFVQDLEPLGIGLNAHSAHAGDIAAWTYVSVTAAPQQPQRRTFCVLHDRARAIRKCLRVDVNTHNDMSVSLEFAFHFLSNLQPFFPGPWHLDAIVEKFSAPPDNLPL